MGNTSQHIKVLKQRLNSKLDPYSQAWDEGEVEGIESELEKLYSQE